MIVVGRHDRNAPKTAHRARQGFNAGGAVAVVVRDENVHAGQKAAGARLSDGFIAQRTGATADTADFGILDCSPLPQSILV